MRLICPVASTTAHTERAKVALHAPGGGYPIKIDPRAVDVSGMSALRRMGFNRVSLGVQDFDP